MVPSARFDDLTPGHQHAFELLGHTGTTVATTLDEVVPALEMAEKAARDGLWAAGYVSYEAAPAFDATLPVRPGRAGEPMSDLPLVWLATFERREPVDPLRPRASIPAGYNVSGWAPDIDAAQWGREIADIREKIAAGDTNQVNHSFRLRAAFAGDPWELYRDVALAQRGAHAAWLDTGRYQVASASPELFFRIDDGKLVTRPMKGTIHRGRWSAEDSMLAEQLLMSGKDRAENLMIVDLLRDDLEQIARPGSIRADRLLELERYETLWTLTSEVIAEVAPNVGLVDIFRAMFPSGSVTGVPKRSTMGIIADLEPNTRGVYCGVIGYLAPYDTTPVAQFSVAIRTVVIDIDEGLAEYGVGGGITWHSDAGDEYEETRTKARLLAERRPDFELVETMRWEPGTGFALFDRHLVRLEASAAYFGFVYDAGRVREMLDESVTSLDAPVRIELRCKRDGAVGVEVDEWLLDPFATSPRGFPVRLALGEPVIDPRDVFLYHQTTRRSLYDSQRDRHPDAADVLLVNHEGELTQSTISNIVLRFGDTWWTPPLASGLLPGVYREELLGRVAIRERPIRRDEVLYADEIALIDSVRGWRRANLVTGSVD